MGTKYIQIPAVNNHRPIQFFIEEKFGENEKQKAPGVRFAIFEVCVEKEDPEVKTTIALLRRIQDQANQYYTALLATRRTLHARLAECDSYLRLNLHPRTAATKRVVQDVSERRIKLANASSTVMDAVEDLAMVNQAVSQPEYVTLDMNVHIVAEKGDMGRLVDDLSTVYDDLKGT